MEGYGQIHFNMSPLPEKDIKVFSSCVYIYEGEIFRYKTKHTCNNMMKIMQIMNFGCFSSVLKNK